MLVFIKTIVLCFFLIIDYSTEQITTLSTDYENTTLMTSTTVTYTPTVINATATLTSTTTMEAILSTDYETIEPSYIPTYSNYFQIPFVFY